MAEATTIKIKADASQAKAELRGFAEGALGDLTKRMGLTMKQGAMLAAGVAAIGTAAAVATRALIRNANAVAENGDKIAKTARIVGVSGQAYQELAFAADRAGVSTSSMDNGLKRLARNLYDANTGNKRLAQTFADMGVKTKDAAGNLRGAEDVLKDIADRAKALGPSTQLTAELMTVLGRSGADMANLLAGGSDELERMADRAHELGGVMSDELLAASERYQDSLTDLSAAWTGLRNKIAESVIPILTDLADTMTETVIPATGNLMASIADLPSFFGELGEEALRAIPGLDGVADALDRLREREEAVARERRKNLKILSVPRSTGVPEDIDISETLRLMPTQIGGGGQSVAVAGGSGKGVAERVAKSAAATVERQSFDDFVGGLDNLYAVNDAIVQAEVAKLDELDRLNQEYEAKRKAQMEREVETFRAVGNAQTAAASEVFGAVSTFAELAQKAVEDSYFGQTKAGKAAAKAAFIVAKLAALAQAAVNTALGVTNALATPTLNPAVNAGLAVAVGAAGAAQIGVIGATTIQGLADGGLAPGELRRAGLNNHTVIGVRNDEAVIDPRGTKEITAMLALQRRQMEMGLSQSANAAPSQSPPIYIDGRRITRALSPYQTEAIEDGQDPRQNVRYAGALS